MPDNVNVKVKKAGRKRRVLGWMLLALGLLVAGVWGASRWWWVERSGESWDSNCAMGVIWIWHSDSKENANGWRVIAGREGFRYYDWRANPILVTSRVDWDFWFVARGSSAFSGVGRQVTCIVLWPIPLLLWIPAALLLRSGIVARRNAMGNRCRSCRYDLAGLGADASCSECGNVPR